VEIFANFIRRPRRKNRRKNRRRFSRPLNHRRRSINIHVHLFREAPGLRVLDVANPSVFVVMLN
jgi:hypothetical protein